MDSGFTDVPNIFFDHYHELGIKPQEFMLILHLARYQWERPDSRCYPSLATVAKQMGWTPRYVRRLLAGLEERGLLKRELRPGKTSLYDFSAASRAILEIAKQRGEEPEDLPSADDDPDPQNGSSDQPGTRDPGTPELEVRRTTKENKKSNNNSPVAVELSADERHGVKLLTGYGVTLRVANQLAREYSTERIKGWIEYLRGQEGIRNQAGFLVSGLRSGDTAPPGGQIIHVPAMW
jgi:DNA-binding MarR family transcriptional regulator